MGDGLPELQRPIRAAEDDLRPVGRQAQESAVLERRASISLLGSNSGSQVRMFEVLRRRTSRISSGGLARSYTLTVACRARCRLDNQTPAGRGQT